MAPHTPTGSRRTPDVSPSSYSPTDRPSSSRAAPAKNRTWSSVGGISSVSTTRRGFPVSRTSRAPSSSACAASRSAAVSSASIRSRGVVRRQPRNASAATAQASSTSAGPESAASAHGSPVTGSTEVSRAPSAAGRVVPPITLPKNGVIAYSPPAKLSMLDESFSPRRSRRWTRKPMTTATVAASSIRVASAFSAGVGAARAVL